MLQFTIQFYDGSVLENIFLYKESTMWTSIILDESEAKQLLHSYSDLYFGNRAIQGRFIPQQIQNFSYKKLSEDELSEGDKLLLKEIKKLEE